MFGLSCITEHKRGICKEREREGKLVCNCLQLGLFCFRITLFLREFVPSLAFLLSSCWEQKGTLPISIGSTNSQCLATQGTVLCGYLSATGFITIDCISYSSISTGVPCVLDVHYVKVTLKCCHSNTQATLYITPASPHIFPSTTSTHPPTHPPTIHPPSIHPPIHPPTIHPPIHPPSTHLSTFIYSVSASHILYYSLQVSLHNIQGWLVFTVR